MGTYLHNGTSEGSIAEYKCNAGFHVTSGKMIHVCNQSTWIGQPLQCSEHLSQTEIQTIKQDIEHDLHVDHKTTSIYKRRYNCANDDRPSSKGIGATGVFVLVMCLSLIVAIDCTRCTQRKPNDKDKDKDKNPTETTNVVTMEVEKMDDNDSIIE